MADLYTGSVKKISRWNQICTSATQFLNHYFNTRITRQDNPNARSSTASS